MIDDQKKKLKEKILRLTAEYARLAHQASLPAEQKEQLVPFDPVSTSIPYAARVFAEEEVQAAVSASLDFWLTLAEHGDRMERKLADFLHVRSSVLVNSGSSANLIACSALTSHLVDEERRLRTGDEVITCAAGFPTTVAPIVQNGAVPVFIDCDPLTGNACTAQLEQAYQAGKTKAVLMAHALGNPFNLSDVISFCRRHNLWLIEDNCDALGSSYSVPAGHMLFQGNQDSFSSPTGSWGDLSTQSFYPPHHLTMGEGGAVNIVRDLKFKRIVESLRDWGRDCWCPSGKDNTCGKRYEWALGELPGGYDHKYVYSHFGYNLKPLDIQAAIGEVQLRRLEMFTAARRNNWLYLRRGLNHLGEYFDFMLPTHATSWSEQGFNWDATGCRSNCSWFAFLMLVKDQAPFSRAELAIYLAEHRIATRMLFGGNLLRQPVFVELKKSRPQAFRISGDLSGSDMLMNQALFLGTFPGLTRSMLDYIIETMDAFVKAKTA